jgi:hypothetical protein
MQETSSADGNLLIRSLSAAIIALVLGSMLYAVAIAVENITRIGV